MTDRTAEATLLFYARVAGLAYLVIILTSLLNVGFIDAGLIIPADDAATVANIRDNGLLFRLGIVAALVIYASVVVLAATLYVVLKTVNRNLALLAMLLRTGEAMLGAATAFASLVVPVLLEGAGRSVAFPADQLQALVGLLLEVRTAALDIVLVFVGLGGTIFCYLLYKALYVPRILAGWGIFTYLSMLLLAIVSILWPGHPAMAEIVLYGLGTLFEVAIGFRLLLKGVDLQHWRNGAHSSPAT